MRRLGIYIFSLILLITVVIVFLNLGELSRIATLFKQTSPIWLLAAIIAQVGTYLSDTQAYVITLQAFRVPIRWREVIKASIIMEFLADVTPTLGMTGNVYLMTLVRGKGLPAGAGAIVLMVQSATSFLAYTFFLAGAAVYLLFAERLSTLTATITLAFVSFGVLFWIIVFFVFSFDRLIHFMRDVVGHVIRKLPKGQILQQKWIVFIDEVREGRTYAYHNWGRFSLLFAYKIARLLFDTLTAYFLFYAIGNPVDFNIVVIGYAMAMLLSTISLIPGGIGSFEAAMVFAYTSYGVSLEAAGVATLMFRALTFWLPVPIGLWLFRTVAIRPKKR